MDIIKINHLYKQFGTEQQKIEILKDINLHIQKGDFVAIIGQSGSGKSTLMNIIGCLDTLSQGSYKIHDQEVKEMSVDQQAHLRSKTFGFIFQRYNLLANLTALENVALPAIYNGVATQERESRARQLLTDLGLEERIHNMPNTLSGGQQQRVSIARALMNGGEIILADEPTGALDSKSGKKVMEILIDLHQKGHTIILVTHDPKIAEYASRVIEIKDGEIIQDIRQNSNINTGLTYRASPRKNRFIEYQYMLIESFKMAIQAILSHKMRSLLTMLGIIIGIASVVTVIALGEGSTQNIMANINAMGTNTIEILPGKDFGDMHSNKIKTLTVQDANFLEKQSYIASTTPNSSSQGLISFSNQSVNGQLNGVGMQYFDVKGIKLVSGRFFNEDDINDQNSVIIIDQNTQKRLFANEDPLGKTLFFNKKPFKIIGITQETNNMGMNSENLNLWAPYTTVMYKITGGNTINSITVKIADQVNSQIAQENITQILITRHNRQDFFMINSDSIKQTIESTTSTMTLLISGIAFISLLVGGIGVMNIMLVSVKERIKEIGLRMAIGAQNRNILQQFLIEAILICTIGGILGLILSGLIGLILPLLLGNLTLIYSTTVLLFSLFFSSCIGIIFGFMPAKNASKLQPIEALTQE